MQIFRNKIIGLLFIILIFAVILILFAKILTSYVDMYPVSHISQLKPNYKPIKTQLSAY